MKKQIKIFVVWACYGRENGHLFVCAKNKTHARKIAKAKWAIDFNFPQGVVPTQVDSYSKYSKSMELEDEDIDRDKEITKDWKMGDWQEIEWGT